MSLYILKLDAVRIGDSPAAAILTLITGPTDELREAGDDIRERSDRQGRRQRFWADLLALGDGTHHTHATVMAPVENWVDAGAGISGVVFKYRITMKGAEVLVMLRRSTADQTQVLYDRLAAERDAIEAEWGGPMEWDPKPGRKKCEIVAKRWDVGLDDEDQWRRLQREMFDAMQRLAAVMRPAERLRRG